MLNIITDNNEFLADGVTPNPNFGQTTEDLLPAPETPKPAPPQTTKQQIIDQIAVLKVLADKLS